MTKRVFKIPALSPQMGTPRETPTVAPVKGKFVTGSTAPPEHKEYTGDKMVCIAIMHKSCLQPVFSEEAAKDSASMRR